MRIKTTTQINARTHDGRQFTADEDSVEQIDDNDDGMVGLVKALIMSGQAEHYGDAGVVEEEPAPVEPVEESDDEDESDDATDEDD